MHGKENSTRPRRARFWATVRGFPCKRVCARRKRGCAIRESSDGFGSIAAFSFLTSDSMALVSVVIPTHNRSRCIERALSSVLAQTCADFEAIVVDDGSTDDTVRVVERYARKDARIRLIQHSHRKGAQAARNSGIHAAQGQWIAFLDSDDQLLSDSLQMRLQLATKQRLHVVHSECYVLNPDSTEMKRFGVPPMQGQVYKELLQRPGPAFPGMLVSTQ